MTQAKGKSKTNYTKFVLDSKNKNFVTLLVNFGERTFGTNQFLEHMGHDHDFIVD